MKNKDQEKEQAYAEIMYLFRYFYHDQWAPGHIFDGKTRTWVQAFNELVEEGYVKRRKTHFGYKYKWAGVWPDDY